MLRAFASALALTALLCVGCQRDAEPPPGSGESAGDPSLRAAKSLQRIDWPDDSAIDERALAALSAESRRVVATSPVPVLVLDPSFDLASAVLLSRGAWYALSLRSPGLTIALSATHLAHEYPEVAPARGSHEVRGGRGFVTRNEGIWSVTWIERGASYKLDVECASAADPRCASDAFVRDLAERLVYVGGSGQRSTP